MKVLVVGSGGREHALVKALRGSTMVKKVYVWPGNDGMALEADCAPVPARGANEYKKLVQWTNTEGVDFVVIGPEADLVAGLSDLMRENDIPVFGPSQEAAQLEGSKIYAKNFMKDFGVPTSRSDVVSTVEETLRAAETYSSPYVLKADGLAAGKGVFICATLAELENSARDIFENKKLGDAGSRALLEEFQPGQELSVLALTNGKDFELLPYCRDHKRLLEGDLGPNTGGMGVVGPIAIDSKLQTEIVEQVLQPTMRGLLARNLLFRGVIFIGIMLTAKGPQVLEYNVRFGDPETQVILPLLDGDWAQTLLSVAKGEMPALKWRPDSVACIVLAAEGYPDNPVKGSKISGGLSLEDKQSHILHAGTKREGDHFVTNGGRVLNVVSRGGDLASALSKAYSLVQKISWAGMQYRKDIGRT